MAKFLIILIFIPVLSGCSFGEKNIKISKNNGNETKIITYTPPEIVPNEIKKGSCWITSSVVSCRADAWRCATEDEIKDPCFSMASQHNRVFCVNDPWKENEGFQIELTKPLPTAYISKENKDTCAWFLELDDGTTCSSINGASDVNGKDERANYACSVGGDIYGDLSAGSVWTTSDNRRIKTIWR